VAIHQALLLVLLPLALLGHLVTRRYRAEDAIPFVLRGLDGTVTVTCSVPKKKLPRPLVFPVRCRSIPLNLPSSGHTELPLEPLAEYFSPMGMPPKKAAVYIEMFKAINAGVLAAQEPRSRENTTPTSFEKFVQDVFAACISREGSRRVDPIRGGGCACVQE
jgi:hypothetical protein